jgi:hypothetical protein
MAGFFMRGRMRGMPRFSIKDLMLATTLIAVGLAVLILLPGLASRTAVGIVLPFVFWLGGCVLIGVGLFTPFHKKRLGAGIGAGAALFFVVIVVIHNLS